MSRFALLASLAMAIPVLAQPALADEVAVSHPIEAATLAIDGITLVSYFVPQPDGAYEVTATWIVDGEAEPHRIVLRLQDGDHATFALPGQMGTLFDFSRAGTALTVGAAPVWVRTASL